MSNKKGQEIGYIRVSTVRQNADRQLDGLNLDKTFVDKVSGGTRNRPQLQACLDYVRDGDTLHVHSLDRLARSLLDLETLVSSLVDRGVTVKFHSENMVFNQETDNAMGKLIFQILGAFAEFERRLIYERQMEGIALAKAQGKHLGRQPALTPAQAAELVQAREAGANISQLARKFGVARSTIHEHLKKAEATA